MEAKRNKIVVITGPTATGKTALAIECARRLGGEILSADSMQIYRYMDIGTAKPTEEERRQVKHHMLDIIDPNETFNAARYAQMASTIASELTAAGRLPIVVGGTGLYIDAFLGGLIEAPAADKEFRDRHRLLAERHGSYYIYSLLEKKDPEAAERIHPRDRVRIIRALEVLEYTGKSIVKHQRGHGFAGFPTYLALKIGLSMDREDLFKTINERVEVMNEKGLVQETKNLMHKGYNPSSASMQAFCYRHIIDHIDDKIGLEEALRRLKRDTRKYAKRQITWFKRDGSIRWFKPEDRTEIFEMVETFLTSVHDKSS